MFGPDETPAARAARSGPTTSTRTSSTWRPATSASWRSRGRRSRSCSRTGSGWAGASSGSRRRRPTSTTTSASRSRPTTSRGPSTTTASAPGIADREGISVFFKDENGDVFHTYSSYARGIDLLNTRVQLPRPGPEGPRRGRRRPVLGPPPRRIRHLTHGGAGPPSGVSPWNGPGGRDGGLGGLEHVRLNCHARVELDQLGQRVPVRDPVGLPDGVQGRVNQIEEPVAVP